MRDETESYYVPGTVTEVYALEMNTFAGTIEIVVVGSVHFDDHTDVHAD